jgi:hypothetical protein
MKEYDMPEFFEADLFQLDMDHASDLIRYLDDNEADDVVDQIRELLISAHPELEEGYAD